MMTVLVDIAAAVICFAGACHNALVGLDTPRGEFQLVQHSIQDPRFGGDLLVFKHDHRGVFAVHRLLEIDGQQRFARIHSPHPRHRITVTAGCVNVTPEVYAALVECCADSTIVIK